MSDLSDIEPEERLQELEHGLAPDLEARGGVLDRVDYARLRKLASTLRNIPRPGTDGDLPPVVVAGWVASYEASQEVIQVVVESGMLRVLKAHSRGISANLSVDTLPQVDRLLLTPAELSTLIALAKTNDLVGTIDLVRVQAGLPDSGRLAAILCVDLGDPGRYDERPKVNEETKIRRLRLGAILGQVATGAAFATANLGLGVNAALAPTLSSGAIAIPTAIAIAGSVFAGLNGLFAALNTLTEELNNHAPTNKGAGRPAR